MKTKFAVISLILCATIVTGWNLIPATAEDHAVSVATPGRTAGFDRLAINVDPDFTGSERGNGEKVQGRMPIHEPAPGADHTMRYMKIDPSVEYTLKIVPVPPGKHRTDRFKPHWHERRLPKFEFPDPKKQMKRMMYLPKPFEDRLLAPPDDSGERD